MKPKLITILIVLSFILILLGQFWSKFDSETSTGSDMKFIGIIASVLSVGYFSTPSGSIFGKIGFAYVIVIAAGVAMKLYHLYQGNLVLIVGLAGLGIAHLINWIRSKRAKE